MGGAACNRLTRALCTRYCLGTKTDTFVIHHFHISQLNNCNNLLEMSH